MNKAELLSRIRSLQRELDGLVDAVIAMEDPKQEQLVPVKPVSDEGKTDLQMSQDFGDHVL